MCAAALSFARMVLQMVAAVGNSRWAQRGVGVIWADWGGFQGLGGNFWGEFENGLLFVVCDWNVIFGGYIFR